MVTITRNDVLSVKRERKRRNTIISMTVAILTINIIVVCHYLSGSQVLSPKEDDNKDSGITLHLGTESIPATSSASTDSSKSSTLDIPTLVSDAGVDVTQEMLQDLPTNEQVFELYGDKPQIIGLETCSAFRQSVPPEEAYMAVAGMFNTGTNLLSKLLRHHCAIPEREEKYASLPDTAQNFPTKFGINAQVPWGKHNPVSWRNHHVAPSHEGIVQDNVLPVVMIKDPYHWMGSMCRQNYAALWLVSDHCPNLVKDVQSQELFGVEVVYKKDRTYNYESLPDLWSTWYTDYLHTHDFPRLMIRYEDLLFYPKEVVTAVCECGGGKVWSSQGGIHHIEESAKKEHYKNSAPVGIVSAIKRYGKEDHRSDTMTGEDLAYAKDAISSELMDVFHYSHPE